jgi:hypothetical protein
MIGRDRQAARAVARSPRSTDRREWAVVRHGASPAEALAEVLGVSAEDIWIRDRTN